MSLDNLTRIGDRLEFLESIGLEDCEEYIALSDEYLEASLDLVLDDLLE